MSRPAQRPASNSTARKRGPAPAAHFIVWTFDGDRVASHAVCEAPIGADCRLGPQSYNECQCESWNILRDKDAAPYHYADGGDRAIGDRHYMTDIGECSACVFLDQEDDLAEVCEDDGDTFEIGRTPIKPVWDFDMVTWARVTA